MTALVSILSVAVVLLIAHHVWESRRDSRWEAKIDAIAEGFKALEHIVRGAVQSREGQERQIEDHERRIKRLEEWKRMGEGL